MTIYSGTGPRPGPRCGGWAPGPTKHYKAIQARSLPPVAQLRTELANHAELELYPAMQSMARAESHEAQSETRRLGLGKSPIAGVIADGATWCHSR